MPGRKTSDVAIRVMAAMRAIGKACVADDVAAHAAVSLPTAYRVLQVMEKYKLAYIAGWSECPRRRGPKPVLWSLR